MDFFTMAIALVKELLAKQGCNAELIIRFI